MTTNEAAIKEAMLDAAIAEVVDGKASGEMVIAAAQADEASTTTFVTDRRNADTVTVYNQHDGTPSQILISMLSKQLRKRFPRDPSIPEALWGRRAFGVERPASAVEKPLLMCWLHKDHPKRDGLNAVGLSARFCTKANIPSEMDVRMHVQRKHPQEFRIMNEADTRIREEEDRELRRREVEAMMAIAGNANALNKKA